MKNHCVLALSLALTVASCAAQSESDLKPARPAREAVSAQPIEPAKPPKPIKPAKPMPAVVGVQEEGAKQLKAATKQLEKFEMQWTVADPFGQRDDGNHTLILSR